MTASSVKPNTKKANKAEVTVEESPKEETQADATTPKPKAKGQGRGTPQTSPAKVESKPPEAKEAKVEARESVESQSQNQKRKQQCNPFLRGTCQKGDQCKYEHQVDNDGRPIPVGPEILQKYDEAVKRFNESRAFDKIGRARGRERGRLRETERVT